MKKKLDISTWIILILLIITVIIPIGIRTYWLIRAPEIWEKTQDKSADDYSGIPIRWRIGTFVCNLFIILIAISQMLLLLKDKPLKILGIAVILISLVFGIRFIIVSSQSLLVIAGLARRIFYSSGVFASAIGGIIIGSILIKPNQNHRKGKLIIAAILFALAAGYYTSINALFPNFIYFPVWVIASIKLANKTGSMSVFSG